MRTASAGLIASLAAQIAAYEASTWRADLLTVTLASGLVYRWTSADVPIVISGDTYLPSDGVTTPIFKWGLTTQPLALQITTLDLELSGCLSGVLVSTLARQGLFRGARIDIDVLVSTGPTDVANGTAPWFYGRAASCDIVGPTVKFVLKNDLETLNRKLPRYTLSPGCGNVVYDSNCGLVCAAWTIGGTVSGSTATTISTATAAITSKGVGYFDLGCVTFTTGVLSGKSFMISSWATPTFVLASQLSTQPAIGDAFNVFPGCNRTYTKCNSTFANSAHFRGFRYVPAAEKGSF